MKGKYRATEIAATTTRNLPSQVVSVGEGRLCVCVAATSVARALTAELRRNILVNKSLGQLGNLAIS